MTTRGLAWIVALGLAAGQADASFLLNAQGNQLDRYDLAQPVPRLTMTTPVPRHDHDPSAAPGTDTVGRGNDVNGQICRILQADGAERFVMGEDSDQGLIPGNGEQGWGLFAPTGGAAGPWTMTDKLVPAYNFTEPANEHLPDNTGCAVSADGKMLFLVDLGIGAFDAPAVGSLFVFYRDTGGNFSSAGSGFCVLHNNLTTAGYIAIDPADGSVLVPESGRSEGGVISRFSPPFPKPGETGCNADVARTTFIQDLVSFTPLSIARRKDKWLVSNVFPALITEYDAAGNLVRPIVTVQGPGIAGIAVDPATDDVYFANLGLIPSPSVLSPGPLIGTVWRVPFEPVADTPLPPLPVNAALNFPEGMGIFP